MNCENGRAEKCSNQKKKKKSRKSIVSASNILMPHSVKRDEWKWWSLCQLLDIGRVFNWGLSRDGRRNTVDVERAIAWPVLDEKGRPVMRQCCQPCSLLYQGVCVWYSWVIIRTATLTTGRHYDFSLYTSATPTFVRARAHFQTFLILADMFPHDLLLSPLSCLTQFLHPPLS